MDLRQLSHRNHINDWCTEYTGSEILGRYCSMSAIDLDFRGDSGYFCNYNIDNWRNTVPIRMAYEKAGSMFEYSVSQMPGPQSRLGS